MKNVLQAVERIGTLEEPDLIRLDAPLPDIAPHSLRVILLLSERVDLIDEQQWLRAAAKNPVFDFLKDPAEDIYSVEDRKPFNAR